MRKTKSCRNQATLNKNTGQLASNFFVMSALAICLMLVWAFPASAQKFSGQITGNVTDQNGAALADATVTATQVGTELVREIQTSGDGNYTFTDLPIGTYRLSVKRQGFKESVIENVVVNVATTNTQNIALQIGQLSEQVTVTADAIQVEQSTGALGEVVNGEQVRELPLNGRSFVQLTQLQPGVSAASNFDSKNKGLFSGVDFSVNGNSTQNNLFLIDGGNNNDTGSNRTILLYPSIEAIEEFKMLRNSFSPEYGQAAGAVISIATRGGTNDFHGSLFYFGRNDKLNAGEFFSNANGLPKDKLRRNDFGFSIGGPIVKNKLFFFFSMEWNKEIRGQARFGNVPSLRARSGDFTNPFILSDGVTRCDGAALVGPFAGTQIVPQALQSPAGRLLTQLYPEPNRARTSTSCNNWSASIPASIDFREENVRIDYKLTDKHQIFGRFTNDTWKNPSPLLFGAGLWGDDAFPGVESSWEQPSRQVAVKLTSSLSGSAVNEVQFAYSANRINITSGTGADLKDQIDTAIPSFFPQSGKVSYGNGVQPVFWGGIAPFTSNFGGDLWNAGPWNNSLDIYSIRDDFSLVRGNHALKMGFLYDWAAKDELTNGFSGAEAPQFSGPVNGQSSNYLADVLTRGSRFNFGETSTEVLGQSRYKNIEFYFGDTWKFRPNLTFEFGARWSFFREPYDDANRLSSFDPRFYDPSRPVSDACNGIIVPEGTNPCTGIPGTNFGNPVQANNRSLRENDNNAIAPRLGLAWDPFKNGKTSIRLGLGQFFQRERVSPVLNLAANAPFAVGVGGNRTLDNTGATTFDVGNPGGSPSASIDPRAVLPNSWQWNMTVDQELYKEGILEVAYVGNRAIHQTITQDINQVLPQNRVAGAFADRNAAPNPLRPFGNFGFINQFARTGNASYHALQTLFKTRLFTRSQLQFAYTWSHSIADTALDDSSGGANVNNVFDTSNRSLDKGNSAINRPHIFVANYIFYLPELKDRNSLVRNVLGGWEYASIITLGSGPSLTPRIGAGSISNLPGGIAGTGTTQGNERPNRVAGVSCDIDSNDPTLFINPAAFTLIGSVIGQPGNASRGACQGPGINNWDMSFYKNFAPGWLKPLGEAARIQFRFELFNAFNHAQFRADSVQNNLNLNNGNITAVCGPADCGPGNASRTITSFREGVNNGINFRTTNFGRATSTRGPREIQYSLKLIF